MLPAVLRHALRSMRANPGFTAIAVASIALGIGVNTAVFSLIDQLLLWSVPARQPEQLVTVDGMYTRAYPVYREFRDRNQAFSSYFASSYHLSAGLRPDGAAAVEVGHVHYVSGNYFEGLGVGAAAGRTITPEDDRVPGGSPVVLLSYRYWQRRFGGETGVIGRKLAVNGFPLEIAGIAQKGFGGIYNGREADVFVPLTMFPRTTPSVTAAWDTPNMFWLSTMARLRPGVSKDRAQAELQVLWPRVAASVKDAALAAGVKVRPFREQEIKLKPGAPDLSDRKNMLDPLEALTVATGLVLLIASANVANLLLSRMVARRREIAVRLALGATRGRLIRQLLGESLVLAAAGGVAGVLVGWLGIVALERAEVITGSLAFHPNLRILAASAATTILACLLFGLAPALRATGLTLADGLKQAGPHGSRFPLSKALIALQVALSVSLLVGAGLFLRTLHNLRNVDLGFERENVLIADVDPTSLGYRGHRLRTFYDELLERTRRVPGVRSVALSIMTPMASHVLSTRISVEGYQPTPGERMGALQNSITSGYFTTLGVPILTGRDFRPDDQPAVTPGAGFLGSIGRYGSGASGDTSPNASRLCIIDEALARQFFPGTSAIGRHLSYHDSYDPADALEIVGVVRSIHQMDLRKGDARGTLYIPSWSNGAEVRSLVVRLKGDSAPVIKGIRQAVLALDANVPVLGTRMLEGYIDDTLQRERLIALLTGLFSAVALGLASVGLYGVVAYDVTRRTREVGIRIALGARGSNVVGLVMRHALVPVLVGTAAGIGGALAFGRAAASLLFGVGGTDMALLALASALMLAVALLAALIPARRAARIEPLQALRHE